MLTARLPFDAEWKPNSIRYAQSIRRAQAAGLSSVGDFVADVPEPIAGLCEAMLRIDPATRIDSPDEIARVLGTAVSAPPDWTRQIHPAAAQPRSTEIPEAGVRDDGEGTMPDRPSRLTTDAPVAKKRGAVSSLPAEDSDTEFIRGPGEK